MDDLFDVPISSFFSGDELSEYDSSTPVLPSEDSIGQLLLEFSRERWALSSSEEGSRGALSSPEDSQTAQQGAISIECSTDVALSPPKSSGEEIYSAHAHVGRHSALIKGGFAADLVISPSESTRAAMRAIERDLMEYEDEHPFTWSSSTPPLADDDQDQDQDRRDVGGKFSPRALVVTDSDVDLSAFSQRSVRDERSSPSDGRPHVRPGAPQPPSDMSYETPPSIPSETPVKSSAGPQGKDGGTASHSEKEPADQMGALKDENASKFRSQNEGRSGAAGERSPHPEVGDYWGDPPEFPLDDADGLDELLTQMEGGARSGASRPRGDSSSSRHRHEPSVPSPHRHEPSVPSDCDRDTGSLLTGTRELGVSLAGSLGWQKEVPFVPRMDPRYQDIPPPNWLSAITAKLAEPQDLPPRKKCPASVKLQIEKPLKDTPREEKPRLPNPWRPKRNRLRPTAPLRDLNPIPKREVYSAGEKYRRSPWNLSFGLSNASIKHSMSSTVTTFSVVDHPGVDSKMSKTWDGFRPRNQEYSRSQSTPSLRQSVPQRSTFASAQEYQFLSKTYSIQGFRQCHGVI